MIQRYFSYAPLRSGLALLACLALPACHTMRRGEPYDRAEKLADEKPKSESSADWVLGVDGKPPKGFFHPSRLSGGLSDESREIESDLGIK